MGHVLAIDIGGTKLVAGLVDEAGRVITQRRAPTPTHDGDAMWATLTTLIDAVADGTPLAVGVGSGGPMSAGGETVSPLNIPGWRAFPLRQRLADHVGVDAFVDNDAKALALAEGWVGGARGVRNFMAMVVSTGVGGGIVLDGRLLDGASGNAGHVGHVVVEPDGATLAGHARGVLEGEASGTAIAALTGRPAAEADAATVERTGTMVGRGVASVCNLLDLDLVLVAGSVALGFGEPFFAAAQAEMSRRCLLDFSRHAVIRPAMLGADGPLIGAAAVGWRGIGRDVGVA
ncbi:MAG: ROK family protein [Acidimicrobiales bacterium]